MIEIYQLSFINILSFVSDTCNVMKGTRGGVNAYPTKIIDIYLCIKNVMKTLPLKVEKSLDRHLLPFPSQCQASSLEQYIKTH